MIGDRDAGTGVSVRVADIGTDAALVTDPEGTPVLVLRPGASFGALVAAILSVAPQTSPEDARDLVRRHVPDAVDLGDVMGPPARWMEPAWGVTPRPIYEPLPVLVQAVMVLAAVLVVAGLLVASWGTQGTGPWR